MRGCSPTENGLASIGTMVGWKGGDMTGNGAMGTLLAGTIIGAEGEYRPVIVVAVGLVSEDPGLAAVVEAGRDRDHGAKCWAAGLWDCKPGSSRRNIPV
jgi:hypothetical protein